MHKHRGFTLIEKWNRTFGVNGAWTRRGGVGPEDWPQWMRGLKDC